MRAGSVPYLNAAPLVRGLEGRLCLLPPSRLAVELRRGTLDAGLVSITEALLNDCYDILDGYGVASHGEVYSVFLAHRGPLESVRRVRCDTASLTSVNLLRVLLAERGLRPDFEPLGSVEEAGREEAVLLIGDGAITFQQAGHGHAIWDLGEAWRAKTGLPFVYAVWALRRGVDTRELRRELAEAGERGQREIEAVVRESRGFDEAFRRVYLTRHTHHTLGAAEKEGVARFVELLRRHRPGPVYDPRYVGV
jgi:chorismate dehydratase